MLIHKVCFQNLFKIYVLNNSYCSALNGKYHADGVCPEFAGIRWNTWEEDDAASLTFTEMLIRPKSL